MIHIRPLMPVDLPAGLHLSGQAGWNQTEADWQRFLALQPDGCFVAEWEGDVAGTTVTIILGSVAWIAMVLVEERLRGRGIGRALMEDALAFLDRRGVPTVRLDATPLGQPLYERLGFVEQYQLARYEGVLSPAPAVPGVETLPPQHWEALAALDEEVTETDRRRLLLQLCAEQPAEVRVVCAASRIVGFLLTRRGACAVQLGPCIATAEAGPWLLADAWHRYAGQRVYLDVPLPNEPASHLAATLGLTVQRHLTRMYRGVPRCERVDYLWASSGPEKG